MPDIVCNRSGDRDFSERHQEKLAALNLIQKGTTCQQPHFGHVGTLATSSGHRPSAKLICRTEDEQPNFAAEVPKDRVLVLAPEEVAKVPMWPNWG